MSLVPPDLSVVSLYLQTAAQDQRAADSPQHPTRRQLLTLQHISPAGLLFFSETLPDYYHHPLPVRKNKETDSVHWKLSISVILSF